MENCREKYKNISETDPFSGYDCVIWDFNGTVLDDVDIGIESVNRLLSRRGLKTLQSREEYRALFDFPIIDYYRRLGFDFSRQSYDELAVEWVREYDSLEPTAPVRGGVRELIGLLSGRGVRQLILSATEKTMLDRQLERLGMSGCFEEVLGREDILAGSKTAVAQRWRASNPTARAVVLGDTVHDIETAQTIGADCILVAEGHQS